MLRYSQGEPRCEAAPYCGQRKVKALSIASGILAFVLSSGFIYTVPPARAQSPCHYYASPTGTGNGLSPSTPFQISKFWSVAVAGKTLCLLDGTYTGGSSMIQAPSSFAGTASQPITIRALNEGKVLIDGQDSSRPVDLRGSWGILEGVNVRRGDNVNIMMRGTKWIVRRVVTWDGGVGEPHLIEMSGSNNTIEDCAAFGTAEKLIAAGSSAAFATGNVIRRCWARGEDAGDAPGATNGVEGGYGQDNVTYENILGTWHRSGAAGQPTGLFRQFRTWNSRWLGSIIYMPPTALPGPTELFSVMTDGGSPQQQGDYHATTNTLIKDIVVYVSPTHAAFNNLRAFVFAYQGPGPRGSNNRVENIVGIAGMPSIYSSADYTVISKREGATLTAALGAGKSVFTEVPGICKRYINGQLTNEPLWPWPMNQRIKDALLQSGRAQVDVTQTIEAMFGPIPVECTTGSPGAAKMPAPRNVRVLSIH
jgi:hypothetical protein